MSDKELDKNRVDYWTDGDLRLLDENGNEVKDIEAYLEAKKQRRLNREKQNKEIQS